MFTFFVVAGKNDDLQGSRYSGKVSVIKLGVDVKVNLKSLKIVLL